jgi:hypothetical protein
MLDERPQPTSSLIKLEIVEIVVPDSLLGVSKRAAV